MLSFSNISKMQGGELLIDGASFQINPGEKVGLVGPNGAGKTTLFRMVIGEEIPDKGAISFPNGMRLAYFSQNVGEMRGRTALQEVEEGDPQIRQLKLKMAECEERLADYENISEDQMAVILEQMGEVQTEFEKRGGYDLESRAQEILTGLGIAPHDHNKKVEDFSGGWKMRIALAKVLVLNPDLILMDEPTNYLDMETIQWLEEWLKNFKGAIFMTTHDRVFMKAIAKKIVEISNRKITVYNGDYEFYLKEKEVRLNQIKAEHARQAQTLMKEEEFIARFKARASHAAQVQSRVKKLEKIDRVEIPPDEESIDFEFPTPPMSSEDVVIMDNLGKFWPDSNGNPISIFSGLTGIVRRREKIAVVGVNGAGKSTFLKVVSGQTDPTSGSIRLGPSTRLGYFSQYSLEIMKGENTVFEQIRDGLPNASDGYLRNLLAAFLFKGDEVFKKVKVLSGGEKSRLVLATLLSQNNNLLVLDEPTNHLDIQSREVLLNALVKYEGTILFVSHDRYFLHALAAKVFEVDHGGITIYPGNYGYYLGKHNH